MPEISHGGNQGHLPHGQLPSGQLPPADVAADGKLTNKSTAKVIGERAGNDTTLQDDSIAQATTTTNIQDNEGVKVTGFAWGTMSQNELDRAAPGDPRIGGHTGKLATSTNTTGAAEQTQTGHFKGAANFVMTTGAKVPGGDAGAPEIQSAKALTDVGGAKGVTGSTSPGKAGPAGNTGTNQSGPPSGPSGTGNPFFNPNPMTAFFAAFQELVQLQKWNDQVANKLATLDIEVLQETGKAEAKEDLDAGKAALQAGIKQAIVSGVMAGVSVASLGMTAFSSISAKAAAKEQETAAKEAEDQASKKLKDLKADKDVQHFTGEDALGKIKGNNKFLEDLKNARSSAFQRESDFDPNNPLGGKQRPGGQFHLQQEDLPPPKAKPHGSKFDFEDLPPEGTPEWNARPQNLKVQEEHYNTLRTGNPNLNKLSSKELDSRIASLENENAELMKGNRSASKKLDKAQEEVDKTQKNSKDLRYSRPNRISELRRANMVTMEAISGAVNQIGNSANSLFQAQGTYEQKVHEARAKLLSYAYQIVTKGLDLQMDVKKEDQTDQITQLLQKLSDSISAFHWA